MERIGLETGEAEHPGHAEEEGETERMVKGKGDAYQAGRTDTGKMRGDMGGYSGAERTDSEKGEAGRTVAGKGGDGPIKLDPVERTLVLYQPVPVQAAELLHFLFWNLFFTFLTSPTLHWPAIKTYTFSCRSFTVLRGWKVHFRVEVS